MQEHLDVGMNEMPLYFVSRGYFRLATAVGVDLFTRQIEWGLKYLTLVNDEEVLFADQPNAGSIVTLFGTGGTYYLQASNGRWIGFRDWKDNIKQGFTTYLRGEATPVSLQYDSHNEPEKGFVFQADINGEKQNVFGLAFVSVPNGFSVSKELFPRSYPQYTLPPLIPGRSFKGCNYDSLPFSGRQLFELNLDETSFNHAEMNHSFMMKCTLRKAKLTSIQVQDSMLNGNDFSESDWSDADLSRSSFERASFKQASLSRAKLTSTRFNHANMTRADLNGAELDATEFYGTDLTEANLRNVNWSRAKFDTSTCMKGVDYSHSDLTNSSFANLDLTKAVFRGARLDGCDFRGANLDGADFSETDLTHVLFDEYPKFSCAAGNLTKFCKAVVPFSVIKRRWSFLDLSNARLTDLPDVLSDVDNRLEARHAVLSGLELQKQTMQFANFQDSDLRGVNFSKSNLDFSQFTGALAGGIGDMPAPVFFAASLMNADFSRANLTGADFSHCYFYGQEASVANAEMPLVKFNGAYLAGMNFKNVSNLRGANFSDACLVNCVIRGSNLSPYYGANASLARACLQGVDFEDSVLYAANMNDAAISEADGILEVTIVIEGEPITMPVPYAATRIPSKATDHATKCPSSQSGPCIGEKLHSDNAPMHKWPTQNERSE
ncbi:pentapeptide repeat protein [Paenibacillus curdlanolyticus YK9]|uniref:Pentapeptide repeat protein n=1 Tax=Paenibacillus curdlanolyticus YK9 TaxID=717606 RepID=E0I5D5_9BACL|nr:pentapeptide repeat-containing protein [Paenibacillus curdlanolyticus]EFM12177.1 pentapeptide repeat protein [Paenibacillus curdlanolyticus YK9]